MKRVKQAAAESIPGGFFIFVTTRLSLITIAHKCSNIMLGVFLPLGRVAVVATLGDSG
jgi:hypothetical protein